MQLEDRKLHPMYYKTKVSVIKLHFY